MLRSQIAAFYPLTSDMNDGHYEKSTQNAHVFGDGCSYALKHKEVRERPNVHSATAPA